MNNINTLERDIFTLEAINIADQIIDEAIKDDDGWHWETHDHLGNFINQDNLYNGNSGIIFFLIEIYKITESSRYFSGVVNGCNWLINYNYESQGEIDINLYCGLGGIIHVLISANELYGNDTCVNHALKIVSHYQTKRNSYYKSDILTGTAGSLLTLLHLHNKTKSEWLLDEIKYHIDILFENIIVFKNGICWDRDGKSVHPLCGFSHGASGVAFIFIELYRYFNNEIFLNVAEHAFEYENLHVCSIPNMYNGSLFGWPDFRKDVVSEEGLNSALKAFSANNIDEFVTPGHMCAWCHGAAGIGMARLHAFDVTKTTDHLNYFNSALRNIIYMFSLPNDSYTLCHGTFGNLNLMLDYYVFSGDKKALKTAKEQALKCLSNKEKMGYYKSGFPKILKADCSLFMGTAGIGHFLLRLSNPYDVDSILLPKIKECGKNNINDEKYNRAYFFQIMYQKLFPNTSLVFDPPEIPNQVKLNNIKEYIVDAVNVAETNLAVLNALHLDNIIFNLSSNILSDSLLYIRYTYFVKKYNSIDYDNLSMFELFQLKLSLNSNVILEVHEYKNYKKYNVLFLSYRDDAVKQYTITKYTYSILKFFEMNDSVESTYNDMKKQYSNININNVYSIFRNQLKNCLLMEFLIVN